jgi:hypothetical protein
MKETGARQAAGDFGKRNRKVSSGDATLPSPTTLSDLDITNDHSSQRQQLADVPAFPMLAVSCSPVVPPRVTIRLVIFPPWKDRSPLILPNAGNYRGTPI